MILKMRRHGSGDGGPTACVTSGTEKKWEISREEWGEKIDLETVVPYDIVPSFVFLFWVAVATILLRCVGILYV